MKIKDIVNEGVLGSIGRGLGAVGTGVLRGLDKLGGGTGDVGTARQREAYKQKQADKQFQKKVASFSRLGNTATQEFLQVLRQHGVDINRAGSFDPAEVQQELKFFADHFFGTDADPVISQYVKQEIEAEPLPNQINPTSIEHYLSTINGYRTTAITNRYAAARTVAMHNLATQEKEKISQAQQQVEIDNLVAKIKHDEEVAAAEKQRYGKESAELAKRLILNKKLYTDLTGDQISFAQQPQQQPQQPAANKPVMTPGGVQVVSMNPIHFRYKKQDYILKADAAGNEKWVNIAGKDIPTVTADFLNRQLEAL